MRRPLLAAALVVVATALAAPVSALAAGTDSTPVGQLPQGPVTTVTAPRGALVPIVLRKRPASTGLVWRLARPVDPRIARQVSEGEIDDLVVVVYRLTGRGTVSIRHALTRGDSSPTAVAAGTARITSR